MDLTFIKELCYLHKLTFLDRTKQDGDKARRHGKEACWREKTYLVIHIPAPAGLPNTGLAVFYQHLLPTSRYNGTLQIKCVILHPQAPSKGRGCQIRHPEAVTSVNQLIPIKSTKENIIIIVIIFKTLYISDAEGGAKTAIFF